MNIKYIVFKKDNGDFPVIFPAMIKHSMIAESIQSKYPGIVPISAGFVEALPGRWISYGKSASLKLKSNPEIDNDLLNIFLNIT